VAPMFETAWSAVSVMGFASTVMGVHMALA
jgi:hypothetical protein